MQRQEKVRSDEGRILSPPSLWLLIGGLVLLCLIWGSTWLVIREGLADMPPMSAVAIRFSLAGACLILIAPRLARVEGGVRPPRKLALCYGFLTLAIPYGIIYEVETVLPSGLVSILWSTFPMFIAFCAHLVIPEERLGGRQWVGLITGFLGVSLLFFTDVKNIGEEALPYALLLLVSPAVSAIGNTLIKRDGEHVSSALLNRDGTIIGAILLIPVAIFREHDADLVWSRTAIASILYLSLVGSLIAFSLYFWLLRYTKATRMSLLVYGIPMVAVTLGVLFGDESVSRETFFGMGAILLGLFLVLKPARSSAKGEKTSLTPNPNSDA